MSVVRPFVQGAIYIILANIIWMISSKIGSVKYDIPVNFIKFLIFCFKLVFQQIILI